ncbi:MAG: PP2C family protein-serine/threonine phosphatase [Lachnospiraceae bacterium]|nr:PP2C family protein-serine/threonine phosphatase [Lachnospiraceae bacterium]
MASVSIAVGYSNFTAINDNIYEGKAKAVAATNAVLLDAEQVAAVKEMVVKTLEQIPSDEQILSSEWGSDAFNSYLAHFSWIEETTEYQKIRDILHSVREINDLRSCYIVYVDRADPRCVYLVDASSYKYCPPGVIDPLYEENRGVLDAPMLGFPPYTTRTPEYGWLITAGAPITDKDGNVIAYSVTDIDMNLVRDGVRSYYRRIILILVAFMILLIVVFLISLHRQVISPIRKLSAAALQYTQNKKMGTEENVFGSLPVHRGDEVGNLADAMQLMEREVNEYIRSLTESQEENKRISKDLDIAMRLQMDIMPTTDEELTGITAVDLNAAMSPAKEVGGDFFDFFLIDRDHLAMVMADVSGKGISAATFMVIAKTILRDRTLAGGSPAEVLEQVNHLLCKGNREQMFVTVWLGVLKLSTGRLIMANAGHDYPAIRHGNGTYELYRTENDPPLAAMDHMVYHDVTVELTPGDALFIYTDGIPEAKNREGSRFGIKRMLDALNGTREMTSESVTHIVSRAVQEFVGEADAFDDVTMMSVLYKGDEER